MVRNGDEILVYSTYNDVTRIVEAQQELKESQYILQQNHEVIEMACSSAHFWIFNVDMETRTVYVSEKLQKEFGFHSQAENFPECLFAYHLVRMPVMDGVEAARRIRALERPDAKTLPILAMSANAYGDVKEEFDKYFTEGN